MNTLKQAMLIGLCLCAPIGSLTACIEDEEEACLAIVTHLASALERCGENRSDAQKAMLATLNNCEDVVSVSEPDDATPCVDVLDTLTTDDCTDLRNGTLPPECVGIIEFDTN